MNKGTLSGAAAYMLWGFFPIYFKLIQSVPAVQITAHRVIWSFLLLIAVIGLRRELPALRSAVTLRIFGIYLVAGVLLAINWLVYVWAVNQGYVIEASLGYFINPLVSVLLGVVFLKEKLRPLQILPVALASAGVLYLTLSYGSLPWISLALAFSFGCYGLMKKLAPLGSLHGLALETTTILLPALAYLAVEELRSAGSFGHAGMGISLLLVGTGVVTAAPLILFATAARRVPLTTIGLLQYIAPTLQFLIGVFVFGEAFTPERLVGFDIIWLALAIFSWEGLRERRRVLRAERAQANAG